MTDVFLSVNGALAKGGRILIPEVGVWVAEIDYSTSGPISGEALLVCGDIEGIGVLDTFRSGSYGLKDHAFVVGGAGGWRKILPARSWRNDAFVKLNAVIADTAHECGETVVEAPTDKLGTIFVRGDGTGASLLNRFAPSWHVGLDGLTRFGTAKQTEITAAYELLDYDPKRRVATIASETITPFTPGAVIRDSRLAKPVRIRGVGIDVDHKSVRIRAWGDEI